MSDQARTAVLLAVVLGIILIIAPAVYGRAKPPEPSYDDQWMAGSPQSSPFLELRNEGGSDTPQEPDAPDTPTVGNVGDTSEPEISISEPDDPSGSDQPSGTDSSSTSNQSGQSSRDDGSDDDRSESTNETTSEADTKQADSGSEPEEESSRDSDRGHPTGKVVNRLLHNLRPGSPGGITPDLEASTAPVSVRDMSLGSTSIESEPAEPSSPSNEPSLWWSYRYWILGGLVVLLVTGMFFWFRRRRVTVVERNYPSAEEFFKDELKQKRRPDTETTGAVTRRTRATEKREPVRKGPQSSGDASPSSESILNLLSDYGIDDEHRTLVELYYNEGLTRHEVADQSSMGDGEVGLVLDLADRIKEDEIRGEGT